MVIKPTIGRVVWYWPKAVHGYKDDQPLAAIVVFVHSDHLVNLITFSPTGIPLPKVSVYLAQEGVEHPFKEGFAQWMPYQVGQAKKHEAPKSELADYGFSYLEAKTEVV
jgi:hypothetical protein